MKLAVIAAVADNGVIGRDNQLPWHLPEDLKYFKRVTLGKPIIMGRKTFDSIGRPLPGRSNIVVTRQPDWRAAGVVVAHSLAAALELAATRLPPPQPLKLQTGPEARPEAMLIGGAELYAEGIGRAERLYLTRVHASVDGDAYFPLLDPGQWREVWRQDHCASDGTSHSYSFVTMDRVTKGNE